MTFFGREWKRRIEHVQSSSSIASCNLDTLNMVVKIIYKRHLDKIIVKKNIIINSHDNNNLSYHLIINYKFKFPLAELCTTIRIVLW